MQEKYIYLKHLIILLMTVLPVVRVSASDKDEPLNKGIINYDYVWEYVYSPGLTGGSRRVEHYSFVGEKDVDGTNYHSFKCIELYDEDGKCALTAGRGAIEYLLREDTDEGKVWACVAKDHPYFSDDKGPYSDHEEILIYDFNQKDGETYACAMFYGDFMRDSGYGQWIYVDAANHPEVQIFVQDDGELVIDGKSSRVLNIIRSIKINDEEWSYKKNTVIEGIGCVEGILPVVPYDFRDNGEVIFFTRLLKPDGAVVYEDPDFTDGPVREWVDEVLSGIRNETTSRFNPEDTWEYRYAWWPKSEYGDDSTTFYDVHKLEMKVVDEVSLDGKTYYRMSWNRKDTPEANDSHYFYLRVEDGAYYTYIPEEYCRGNNDVAPGEYLLYDFNMEEGNEYEVPYMKVERYGSEGDMDIFYMPLETVRFHVSKNYTDEEGRRVLEMVCEGGGLFPYRMKVVEGIGPMVCGNIAMFFFSDRTGWEDWVPSIDFEALIDQEGDEIFISDQDRKVGFCKERDYTWVYAEFDKYGNVRYRKMGFNYLCNGSPSRPDVTIDYRRFGTLGVSNNPYGDWEKADFNRCYVREEDGKVWLYHTEGSLHVLYDVQVPRLESLIYDFVAADGEELTFYSPEGEKSAKIATGLTEVGGEDKLSYTFEGSDGVRCVEGIGITKGGILPAVNTEFHRPASADDESFVGAVLVAVYDGEGNLIFRQDLPDAVEAISASDSGFIAPQDRLYDLQGRELREAVPGQPYIKGGKVFVETK